MKLMSSILELSCCLIQPFVVSIDLALPIEHFSEVAIIKHICAQLCQNACVVVNEQKIFCSHQCSTVF